uniref:Uncharacterized protein n=1 Tax=Romanomermis culicivorax TaxID=13658 RepID=A0A915K6M3_ROMCU
MGILQPIPLYFGNFLFSVRCRRWPDNVKRSSSVMSACTAAVPTRKPLILLPVSPASLDVPTISEYEPFVGREWLYHELFEILIVKRPTAPDHRCSAMSGAVICGDSGAGKTAVCYNLARCQDEELITNYNIMNYRFKVSRALLAHHFCKADDNASCRLSDFLLNVIAQTAKRLTIYHEKLAKNLEKLNSRNFLRDPYANFKLLFTDILHELYDNGKLSNFDRNFLIIIDALDESEYHKPEFGDSIIQFLHKYAHELFPDFIKLVLTIKTSNLESLKGLALHKIDLTNYENDERIFNDALEYVNMRLNDKLALKKNIHRHQESNFVEHFLKLSNCNFLYMKLTLNLIEKNHVIVRGANFKILPLDLPEIFQLCLNLKFRNMVNRNYQEKVAPIFNIMLASLECLNGRRLFEILNSNFVEEFLDEAEFMNRLESIQDFIVQKKDETYTFFHPAFREWLIRRNENQNTKYLADFKQGHALIAVHACRKSGKLLDARDLQILSHHLLKAHLYKKILPFRSSDNENNNPKNVASSAKNAQLFWLNLRAQDVKKSLCTDLNVYSPNTKVSRLLLLAGADPDASYSGGDDGVHTLLCEAVKYFRNEFAALLIEFGADVNLALDGSGGATPLIYAASVGNLDAVQFLHQHGAKLSQTDDTNRCALVHAAVQGRIDVLSFFLQCDWSETPPTMTSSTLPILDASQYSAVQKQKAVQQAFVAAAECGQLRACQFLHEFGDASVDEQCPVTKETALSISCLKCKSEIASYLIKNGAKLNYSGEMQCLSPLLRAVEGGCWEIVSSLLGRNIDVNVEKNEKCETALIKVAQTGHIGIMELLLSRDAQLNDVDAQGKTAFCWSCVENRVSCAGLLLDRGAKVNTVDHSGRSPIHYVAENGSKQLVSLLLDVYPNVSHLLETCDVSGYRPLEIAIRSRSLDAVQKFLRKGAKLIPLTWQVASQFRDVQLILLKKLLDDGRVLYKKSHIKEAEHRFKYALKKFETNFPDSDSDTLLPNVGYRTPATVIDKENAIIVDPRRLKYQLLLNLARCRRKNGERLDASKYCTLALNFEPEQSEAYYCRGRCFYESEMYEAAKDDLFTVLKLEKVAAGKSPSPQNCGRSSCVGGNRDSFNSNLSRQTFFNNHSINSNDSPSTNPYQFSKEAADLLVKINDILKKRCQDLKNWEQGSADSGNMPDIESLKV